MDADIGSLRALGSGGYAWSSTNSAYWEPTSAHAYFFRFDLSSVSSSGGPNARYLGFPVRCLVYYVSAFSSVADS